MSAGEYCNRDVVIIDRRESLREAINLMRDQHVGDVVVVDRQKERAVPLGILTDRDIVVEIMARDVDIDSVNVSDVMSYELVTVQEDTKLLDAIKTMRNKGVRRLPVLNQQGGLEGILTTDDILELIAEQLTDIVTLVAREINHEMRVRR